MSERHARVLLRDLQKRRLAPHGERVTKLYRHPVDVGDTLRPPAAQ